MIFCNLMKELNEGKEKLGMLTAELRQCRWFYEILVIPEEKLYLGVFDTDADVYFFISSIFLYKDRLTFSLYVCYVFITMYIIVVSDTAYVRYITLPELNVQLNTFQKFMHDMFVNNVMHLFRNYAFIHTSLDFGA